MTGIADNVECVRERVAAAAARAGRDAADVMLVAVAKTRPAADVRAAVAAGVRVVGENRIQEAEPKLAELADVDCAWHMVGHLQRNKAGKAVHLFDMIESLDSPRLADALDRHGEAEGKRVPVLIEVNTSGEDTKFGVAPGEAEAFAGYVADRRYLSLEGLMTVGPLGAGLGATAGAFRTLRGLFEKLAPSAGPSFRYLSMGMTDDFELAIEEGSNLVRVGRAIFGER
jgi:pyridoxal phosphate enzyme (YggS family)